MYCQKQNRDILTRLNATLGTHNSGREYYTITQNKTQRKNSLGMRVGLSEVPLNQPQYNSNSKTQGLKTRQASIQMTRKSSKGEQSGMKPSKWLDSQKEMMQFIINLKQKKSQSKYSRTHKVSDCFQLEDKREEQKQLLCNRMLVMKKIEKYQKEAINAFYQRDYGKCFGELSKAEGMIKKEKINTPEHLLYINYLYAQFYYKLEEYQKWKMYLQRGKAFIFKIQNVESGQIKEYIMNLRALEVCLALQQEKFEKVLTLVGQIRESGQMSSKIRRRVSGAQISALRKLCKYKQAIWAIDVESRALETDEELSDQKRDTEFGRLFEQKIEMTAEFVSTQEAIQMVEYLIGFQEVSNGSRTSFSYFNTKVFKLYISLLQKGGNKVKLVFVYEKWRQQEQSKKEKLRIQLQLFTLYFSMGIYSEAEDLFDLISSENVVYLGPKYLAMFAQIKHMNGDESQAIGILSKSIDICQDQSEKALYMYKLLEMDLQTEGEEVRQERENILEQFLKGAEKQNVEHVSQLYLQYLQQRDQAVRCREFRSQWRQTASFKDCYNKSGKKVSYKQK